MILHSTVVGIHFVAAVAVACMHPGAVGIVVVGDSALAPSGTCCLPTVAVVVVAAAFVAAIVAAVAVVATVAAVVSWVASGVVADEAAMCIEYFVVAPSRPHVYLKRICLSQFVSS